MLQNFPALGTNGKFILVGGDSAGGNFSAGLTLMCMQNDIRLPEYEKQNSGRLTLHSFNMEP